MKSMIRFTLGILLLFSSYISSAQSFSVQHDTVYFKYSGTEIATVADGIINRSTNPEDSITLAWKVLATDFPSDWQAKSGLVDNKNVYTFIGLWPTGALSYSNKYPIGPGDFHLLTDLSAAVSTGTHYITIRMYNYAVPTDSATETYVISYSTVGVQGVAKPQNEVVLYPNPAQNDVNIVYDPAADVKNITVYNIIGKTMAVYKVSNSSSANLDLGNIPSGLYFARLTNTGGAIVATKKFTKQ